MRARTKKQFDTIAFTGKLLAPISYLVWFVATLLRWHRELLRLA
jgi:hypothetical protein